MLNSVSAKPIEENGPTLYTDARAGMREWSFRDPVVNSKGGKSVFIDISPSQRGTPKIQCVVDGETGLRAPFGLSAPFADSGNSPSRTSLDFSLDSDDLLNFWKEVDRHVLRSATANCEKWFKKGLSEVEISSLYRPIVTEKEGSTYRPTFRTKLNAQNTKGAPRIYVLHNDGKKVSYDKGTLADVTQDARYWPIVQVSGLWFLSRQMGVSLVVSDLLVIPKQKVEFPFLTNMLTTPSATPVTAAADDALSPDHSDEEE